MAQLVQRTLSPAQQGALPDLQRLVAAWAAERPIRLVVLFGSRAKGTHREESDVDLAVWPRTPPPPEERLRWLGELDALVDRDLSVVVVGNDIDAVLGFEIARSGRPLYQSRPELWETERARLWHAYEDSLPFRRAVREDLRRFADRVRRGA